MNCFRILGIGSKGRGAMKTGELIRRYRKLAGMSQAKLGEAAGMSEPAIRNYELGNRTPGPEQLRDIAEALDIEQSALVGYEIDSARDALSILFQLADEFGLAPNDEGGLEVNPRAKGAQKLTQAIKAWKGMEDKAASGEVTDKELAEWKARLKVS